MIQEKMFVSYNYIIWMKWYELLFYNYVMKDIETESLHFYNVKFWNVNFEDMC